MNYHLCPVCGYDKLEEPAADHNICECCGTQFGYHDIRFSHASLRQRWIANGMKWQVPYIAKPNNWNPIAQLLLAGFAYELTASVTQPAAHAYTMVPAREPRFKFGSTSGSNRDHESSSYAVAG